MHYDIKKLLCSTALSLAVCLFAAGNVQAQGVVSLADDMPKLDDNVEFEQTSTTTEVSVPDSISLSDEAVYGGHEEVVETKETDTIISFDEAQPSPAEQVEQKLGYTPTVAANVDYTELGDGILKQIDNDLFSKMSDLEKQTALLTLELRREKVRNEIEALKAQRKKAEEEEKSKIEEKIRKDAEWKNDQERKNLEAQRKLREAEIALETMRQERVLNAYKESMFNENQKWIEANENFYKEQVEAESRYNAVVDSMKTKLSQLTSLAEKTRDAAKSAKSNYDREVASLQSQVAALKNRIEAAEAEKNADKNNPFAVGSAGSSLLDEDGNAKKTVHLADEYAVMEIRGQGEDLIAKLMNADGKAFSVKMGTVLQTGHIVDEIAQTYVRADKGGVKDFIYFSAGGVLDKEPAKSEVEEGVKDSMAKADASNGNGKPASNRSARSRQAAEEMPLSVSQKGIPSSREGMFVK